MVFSPSEKSLRVPSREFVIVDQHYLRQRRGLICPAIGNIRLRSPVVLLELPDPHIDSDLRADHNDVTYVTIVHKP